jgi:hypothetical protein
MIRKEKIHQGKCPNNCYHYFDIFRIDDYNYRLNASIFFEAKLKNNDKELIIGISNEAEISESTLLIINNRIGNQSFLPSVIEEADFENPYKETSGIGLSMIASIVGNLNGKIASSYDEKSGKFLVEFSIPLE